MPLPPDTETTLEALLARVQSGDSAATEAVLERFRPLLRSRTYALWSAVNEDLSSLEWADVEAEVVWQFLARLQLFRAEEGVYFAHYIERMLHFDGLNWLRQQRRSSAVPFSQLVSGNGAESSEPDDWFFSEQASDSHEAEAVERSLSLQEALSQLPDDLKLVVWNCCVLGQTETVAAQQLGLTRSAVHTRLQTALEQLRSEFGVTQSPTTRTGRPGNLTRAGNVHEEFWSLMMAKDDKRPDLVGVGAGRPILLQGTFDFETTGIKTPQLLSPKLRYLVPAGCVAGIRFVRVGNMSGQMVCVSTVVNGMPHRLIPVAANASVHVPLAIVDAIPAGSEIEVHIASEASGTVIIDVGCLQMPA